MLFKSLERTFDANSEWPQFEGAIFAGVAPEVFEKGRKHCRHAVVVSGNGDPALSPVVALDDIAAGRQAAEHLIECGLRNFSYYSWSPNDTYRPGRQRYLGFKSLLAERGFDHIECPLVLPTIEARVSHGHRPALIGWLRSLPKPTGLLAFDDGYASDLAEACLEGNIPVPDHIAIVGVNNDDLLCESSWPPLTSVESDFSRMGFTAARILDQMFHGHEPPAEDRMVLLPPLGVVQRQSTSTLAVSDPNLADALRFIREYACAPCSVDDVLRAVPVGRRWLERQFVAHIGRTPHDEITRVRVETAERLLLRSELNIMEVASKCGFTDTNSFYKYFRRMTGATPAAYRRKSKAGNSGQQEARSQP